MSGLTDVMRSSSRNGWFYESARHSLAARGIRTGRGFFSRKGYFANNEFGPTKSFLATPIGIDPFSGKKLYPKKADLDIPYAPKKRLAKYDFSDPGTVDMLNMQREALGQRYSRMPSNFSRLMNTPTVADESAAPTMPPLAPVSTEMTSPPLRQFSERPPVTPQLQGLEDVEEPIMEDVIDEPVLPAPVREMEAPKRDFPGLGSAGNVMDSMRTAADRTIPSKMQKTSVSTPGVPPETRSLQDESFEVTI